MRANRILVALIAAGFAIRLLVALTTDGVPFDLESMSAVRDGLSDGDPFDVYSQATAADVWRWPYPPAFFPVLLAVEDPLSDLALTPEDWVRIVLSAGDALLAYLVFVLLRERDGEERGALRGAAIIALGPTLIVVSGFHGQLDSVAWLPVVGALIAWQRDGPHRPLWAGLLVGLGASIKTVPIVALFALLPTVRTRREALTLAAATLAVPILLLLPFLVADPHGVVGAFRYRGLGGLGGLSLVAQPELTVHWLAFEELHASAITRVLQGLVTPLTLIAVLTAAGASVRGRVDAPRALVMLLLAVYVAGVNFTVAYAAWGVIALVAAGMLEWAVVLQAWLLVPTALAYGARHVEGWPPNVVRFVYVPMMVALLVAFAIAFANLVRQAASSTPRMTSSEPSPRAAKISIPRWP